MKKILIVSSIPISYPPRDGHSINVIYRSYFLKNMANICSDIIVSENKEYSSKNLIESGIFDNVYSYPTKSNWLSLFKSFFSPMHYKMIRYDINSAELKNIVNAISNNKYYAVIFDHSISYPLYIKLIKYINVNDDRKQDKIIYWSHNIDYIDLKIIAGESNSLPKKIIYYISSKKLEKIEPKYIRNFSKIVSVSSHEIKILRQINHSARIYWIPPILPEPKYENIDQEYMAQVREKVKDYKYKILFLRILNKPSNILPCFWFANNVLPIIKNNLGDKVCFIIAGKDPSKDILSLAKSKKDIFVFPNVSSVLPFYKLADLVVIPLFNPSGIKLKLIEALKYKKKVVARPEALWGAGLEDLVPNSDSVAGFAQKCIQVLRGEINYEIIWEKFEQIYNNEKIILKLLEVIGF